MDGEFKSAVETVRQALTAGSSVVESLDRLVEEFEAALVMCDEAVDGNDRAIAAHDAVVVDLRRLQSQTDRVRLALLTEFANCSDAEPAETLRNILEIVRRW